MPFELKPGQGTLHKQDKEGVEGRPDYRGELNVDGTIYRLAGWVKVSKNGDRWLSLSCELPKPKAALETPVPRTVITVPKKAPIDPDGDIPF